MAPHFKQPARTDGLTEIHFDYCFMSTEGNPLATILLAKENATKMSMATVVPLKGGSIEFPANRVMAFLKEIGLEGADVVLKSDQEPAIKDLLNNIAKRRSATSKLETGDGAILWLVVSMSRPLWGVRNPMDSLKGRSRTRKGRSALSSLTSSPTSVKGSPATTT